jgi:hypothetical protein
MSNEPKSMRDEMNDEWAELAMENIDKLIPSEWGQQINEVILPKLLYFMKMALKKGIKDSVNLLGKEKLAVVANLPVELKDKTIIHVPHFCKIDKSQLKHEFALHDGEMPEVIISYLDVYNKIDSYKNVKDLMADMKNGTLFKGFTGGKDYSDEEQKQIVEQKQIDQTPNSQTPNS